MNVLKITVGLMMSSTIAWSQVDTTAWNALSLEELMNIRIQSASKKSENLFDAPLSASVFTREEIQKAGCTSIMDAFKLMPGLIVREQANGIYDVQLRGMNNIVRTGSFAYASNTTTLVMIDGRPVYSYLYGGTFWETLPVDINDVDRIEVVNGPSSAMYGPNAVSGVINIITVKNEKTGLYSVANAQAGSHGTYIANGSLGYKFSEKLSIIGSGNIQERDRTQTTYYEVYRNVYLPVDSLRNSRGLRDNLAKYAEPILGMSKYAANTFVTFKPGEQVNIDLSAGLEHSKVQKAYTENSVTPFTTNESNSRYLSMNATVAGLGALVSYAGGKYNSQVGVEGEAYDFSSIDALLEYNITLGSLSVKPGLNYRRSSTDDSKYTEALKQTGTYLGSPFNGSNVIETKAASLRADYLMLHDKLRFVAALRVDQFNIPDKVYPSFQFISTYKMNDNNIIRLVYGRSNQSPFINNNYIDLTVLRQPRRVNGQIKPGHFTEQRVVGNTNLKMLTSDMIELGIRSKLADNLQVDLEIFGRENNDYATVVQKQPYTEINAPGDTVLVTAGQYTNIPLYARQLGTTISVNYVANKFQIKPFVTIQDTRLYNFTDFVNMPDASPTANPAVGNLGDPANNNIYSGLGNEVKHTGTSKVYGGAYINYQVSPKFNININPYFFSKTTVYHRLYTDYRDGQRGIDALSGKFLLNAKVSYTPIPQLTIFTTVKNLTNDNAREFYRTDNIGLSVYGGVNFQL